MKGADLSKPRAVSHEDAENRSSNVSPNETFGDVLARRLSRRDVSRGAVTLSAMAAAVPAASFLSACSDTGEAGSGRFKFAEVTAGAGEGHAVADGYFADVLIRWGDPVLEGAPEFDPEGQSAEAQSKQFGYNNDFIGFLPLSGRADHGLLVVNHEYTNEELMFAGMSGKQSERLKQMTAERVAIEMMAHGGSIIEVKREGERWAVVSNSEYARRITALTPMEITGPAAGHDRMKTKADPEGRNVVGMINNCAGAMTPWGTWLTCEENFNGYFWNKAAARGSADAAALERYGVPSEWYNWGWYHERFDIGKEPNESNRFGWVVEIDPLDPQSVPKKRTALGRFKHEGAGNVVNGDGRFVVYQGDDQAFDYIYRFVTEGRVDEARREGNKDLLDRGTLYVARFNDDGTGVWLPLVHGHGSLIAESGFRDQGEVVIHARLAADLLGATKMDRPEDIEVNPKTGKVYCMLTKNAKRGDAAKDAANPRAENKFGHIIEIAPAGGDHAAATFSWEILLLCGDPAEGAVGATFNPETSANGWFANPDNCVIDAEGRLWVATDGNSASSTGRNDGLWGVETEGQGRGTSRLFFQCPVGAEMCGPCVTPDTQTFFVAVQHPGQGERDAPSTYERPSTRWPDFEQGKPPRPAVVAITRQGGGKIGL